MVNEEVAGRAVRIAVSAGRMTGRGVYQALREYVRQIRMLQTNKRGPRVSGKNTVIKGRQSVKSLVRQGQGVNTVDLADDGIRDFLRIAKKYGVDFAIVKDKSSEQPRHTIFFKAKDIDVIEAVLREYAAKRTRKQARTEKPSILEKLRKLKDVVSRNAGREKERRKERAR